MKTRPESTHKLTLTELVAWVLDARDECEDDWAEDSHPDPKAVAQHIFSTYRDDNGEDMETLLVDCTWPAFETVRIELLVVNEPEIHEQCGRHGVVPKRLHKTGHWPTYSFTAPKPRLVAFMRDVYGMDGHGFDDDAEEVLAKRGEVQP